jgi:mono/diheme cytochrome c family protein
MRKEFRLLIGTLLIAGSLWASEESAAVKKSPEKPAWAASGKDLFANYCAICHGSDGTGGGTAAKSLTVAAPDLTLLSRKHGGKFPSSQIVNVLRGEDDLSAHRDKEMPVWAPAFEADKGKTNGPNQRTRQLLKFIESLQKK